MNCPIVSSINVWSVVSCGFDRPWLQASTSLYFNRRQCQYSCRSVAAKSPGTTLLRVAVWWQVNFPFSPVGDWKYINCTREFTFGLSIVLHSVHSLHISAHTAKMSDSDAFPQSLLHELLAQPLYEKESKGFEIFVWNFQRRNPSKTLRDVRPEFFGTYTMIPFSLHIFFRTTSALVKTCGHRLLYKIYKNIKI